MSWRAVWSRAGREHWELLVTSEAGDIAWRVGTGTPAHCRHPLDGFLLVLDLTPVPSKGWEPGDGGSFSRPVVAAPEREGTLRAALAGRENRPRGEDLPTGTHKCEAVRMSANRHR